MLKIKYRELVKHTPTVKIIGIGVIEPMQKIYSDLFNYYYYKTSPSDGYTWPFKILCG